MLRNTASSIAPQRSTLCTRKSPFGLERLKCNPNPQSYMEINLMFLTIDQFHCCPYSIKGSQDNCSQSNIYNIKQTSLHAIITTNLVLGQVFQLWMHYLLSQMTGTNYTIKKQTISRSSSSIFVKHLTLSPQSDH